MPLLHCLWTLCGAGRAIVHMQASCAIVPLYPWRSLASLRDLVDGVLSQCSMASSNGLVQRSGARFRRVQRGPSSLGEPQRPKRTLTASARGTYRVISACGSTSGREAVCGRWKLGGWRRQPVSSMDDGTTQRWGLLLSSPIVRGLRDCGAYACH